MPLKRRDLFRYGGLGGGAGLLAGLIGTTGRAREAYGAKKDAAPADDVAFDCVGDPASSAYAQKYLPPSYVDATALDRAHTPPPFVASSAARIHDVDLTALLGHHQRTGALATLTVKPVPDPSSYGVVILDRDTRVRGFQEKPRRDEARSDLANCGIYVIEPELLERIPAGTFYDFGEDVWPNLVAAGEEVYAYTTMAYWNDVGDLDELRNTILDAVLGHVHIEIPGDEVAPGVWAESGCRIDDSARLDGPVVLGPNVVIEKDAQVRGPAAIGAECVVGKGAAIRSAALLPGTAVPDEGLAIAGIFGDASKLADALLRYPVGR